MDNRNDAFAARRGMRSIFWRGLSCCVFLWLIALASARSDAAISYVQGVSAPGGSDLAVSATFPGAQAAGDLIVVQVAWWDTTHVQSVVDSAGNTYALAAGPTLYAYCCGLATYYAKNIAASPAGGNTVTVTFDALTWWREIRVLEYHGIDTTSPLDTWVGATGYGTSMNSGSLTTASVNELLVAGNNSTTVTVASDPYFNQRLSGTNLAEDHTVATVGTYSANAAQGRNGEWIMQMVAFKGAGTSVDTQAPTSPSGLSANVISTSRIDLSWTASTDNVGVVQYRVERCQGVGCSNFQQIAAPTGTTYVDEDLTASTSFTYRVRAADDVPNLSGYSSTVSATTPTPDPVQGYVQSAWNTPSGAVSSTTVTYAGVQTAGDLNVVSVGWNGSTHIQSVVDSAGNTYTLAAGPTVRTDCCAMATYYAKNIAAAAAGTNTVTVTLDGPTWFLDVKILEYSGLDASSPLDTWVGAHGNGTAMSSGSLTTTTANELLVAANNGYGYTTGSDPNFTQRLQTYDLNIVEDRTVSSVGTYSATAVQDVADEWIMQLLAFKRTADTQAPTVPSGLTATALSAGQIKLTWTASTDNVGVYGYIVERCAGTGCTNFSALGATVTTSFTDSGLDSSTSYTYRLRAEDSVPNLSGYSSTATATPSGGGGGGGDTQAPTAPGSLAASVISSSEIDLSWSASTDNVGVTGYHVERCQGAACSNFAEIATSTSTAFSDTGLSPATTFRYRVRAQDAVPNFSGYSNTVLALTQSVPDTQPPSAPSGLIASAVSGTQVNLSWTGSTDNVAVTSYLVERCQGASCTNFAQVGAPTGTTFSDTGLSVGTTYRYRVRASDAVPNMSPYSGIASATTTNASGTAGSVTYQYDSFGRLKQVTVNPN